ncbi:hypothetical protein EUZ85_25920 [Hahella sp. KA22]|uniref:hypothetical protein n=1 Tax=Hahella sp. KA22 TaxID=1628392 RepID=UPI000FDE0008|nr:hypothetical protein [Hahella sp. KA22]AZZ93974.1 hypothetical protein ENC22_23335 [Hahella sp. KA22]QAY57348.1 hypothetical protein EUZ85_25920 [Hahella sp. KA22]
MSYSELLPANRAVLFANLGQAFLNGEKFPGVFDSAADISPRCYMAKLNQLAESVRQEADKPLLELIRESGVFLPWEVRFIQFGLATLRIAEVFARLCDYYVLIGRSSRQLSAWLAGSWLLCCFTLAYLLYFFAFGAQTTLTSMSVCASAAVAGLVVGVRLAPVFLRNWVEPDSRFWNAASRFPQIRSLVVARSVYQYLLNLGLCVQAGMDLPRTLGVCAKSEPVDWLRQRYHIVAASVGKGKNLSRAFLESGVLSETRITAHPDESKGKPARLWDPGIIEVVRQSFDEQLRYASKVAPLLLLAPLTVVWLVMAFSVG